MTTTKTASPFSPAALAPHVLRFLLEAHIAGEPCGMVDIASHLKIRRVDVRNTLTALHREDLFDCVHGRLTLRGFAVAVSWRSKALPAIRRPAVSAIRAA